MRTIDHEGATISTAPQVQFIDSSARVPDALKAFRGDIVGVDVERADSTAYFRRAALIQVGDIDHCVLLDGVTLPRLDGLDNLLNNQVLAVFHAADNDLEPLARKGVYPQRIADTAVAAAILGLPTGLGPLLHHVLDVSLTEDKDTFQRADWEARPLEPAMLDYAAADVVHLPELWRSLEQALTAAGRIGWYEEELHATVTQAFVNERHWSRVKGSGRLDDDQQARLASLWTTREQLAQQHDLAPNYLLREEALLDFAVNPPRTTAQLVRRAPRNRNVCRPYATELLEALHAASPLASGDATRPPRRQTADDRAVVGVLRQARAGVAADIGVEAGVLCPAKRLLSAVLRDPSNAQELVDALKLKDWQATLLAEPLWDAYAEASSRQRID